MLYNSPLRYFDEQGRAWLMSSSGAKYSVVPAPFLKCYATKVEVSWFIGGLSYIEKVPYEDLGIYLTTYYNNPEAFLLEICSISIDKLQEDRQVSTVSKTARSVKKEELKGITLDDL